LTDNDIAAVPDYSGPEPVKAWHARGRIWVEVSDGRRISFSCSANEKLARATADQRGNIELSPDGLHWPDLDEDLSLAGILDGRYGRPRGGRREGAGRKPSGRVPYLTRLTPAVIARVKSEAIRRQRTECELIESLLDRALPQHD
jgi:hypothetical protein